MVYQYLNPEHTAVLHAASRRCIYLDQPSTGYSDDYLQWVAAGGVTDAYVLLFVAPLVLTVNECLAKIDRDTDAIYGAMLGNRSEEYNLAATEAKAYKDAAYTGIVPGSVQSWATAKVWTSTQSADDILATATQWRGAQSAIRAARLLRKEQVRVTTGDPAARATAMAAWAGFTAVMRGQLGIA